MSSDTAQDNMRRPGEPPPGDLRLSSEEMAALGILQLGDPMLSRRTAPFRLPEEADEVRRIVERLSATADQVQRRHTFSTGAMGLAAPQIGEGRSVALFRPNDEDQLVLINPRVLRAEPADVADWVEDSEGCLSFFDFRCWVRRPSVLVVEHLTMSGETVVTTFDRGRHARDVLHEIDHLNGLLYFDSLTSGELKIFVP